MNILCDIEITFYGIVFVNTCSVIRTIEGSPLLLYGTYALKFWQLLSHVWMSTNHQMNLYLWTYILVAFYAKEG